MGYPIEVYRGISFAINAVNNICQYGLIKTRRYNTHELVNPFLGKSFEIVVWPPSKPALGFPLPDRAFWPL